MEWFDSLHLGKIKTLENQGIKNSWSGNKGYSKLLIVKVDKQLITKIIIP